MPEFISKLQYKTYEKGEYSDEKVRNLEETLLLIKNFPWDEQRGADVQLTGPSVTIQDEYSNYLKVGLYFNGKFFLYYLDCDHHLYESHANGLDEVYNTVTNFFNGEINLQKFDRNVLSIGAIKHFENANYEYRVNGVWFSFYLLLMMFFLLVAFSGTFAFFMVKNMPFPLILLYLFLDILCLQAFYFMIRIYLKSKNMLVTISRGREDFEFGNDDKNDNYNKKNVSSINIYGQSSRSSKIFNLMEVVFKDDTSIIIPGIIIEPFTFIEKFPGIKVNFVNGYIKGIKEMWNFTK